MEISPPHLLARLPRSSRPGASTQFSAVCSVRSGVKRRRKELCAAIDGDSLSIYEVENGNIIASYPVPPTSSFAAPPLSVVEKKDGHISRRTFCAIKRSNVLHIQSFLSQHQNINKSETVTSPELSHHDSPVRLLDLVEPGGLHPPRVLVVQQDASVTLLSEDLSQLISQISVHTAPSTHILAAHHLSAVEAPKSILKYRADLVHAAGAETTYLVTVTSRSDDHQSNVKKLYYSVFAVAASNNQPRIDSLFEHEIKLKDSDMRLIDGRNSSCTLSPQASYLYLRMGGSLITFELSGLLPRQTSAFQSGFSGSQELMALSPAYALSSYQETLRLFDLRYQTRQASIDLKRLALKRKRNRPGMSDPQTGSIELITYLPQLARILGRRGNQLVAIDIITGDLTKRGLMTGIKLIQSIGQGFAANDPQSAANVHIPQLNIGSVEQSSAIALEWQRTRKHLDQLAQAGDLAEFEDAFIDEIRKSYVVSSTSTTGALDDLSLAGIADIKIKYVLAKIFQLENSSGATSDKPILGKGSLRIQLSSFRLILWFSRLKLLSSRSVQIALSTTSSSMAADKLSVDAVAQALVEADPSLDLLHKCIENGFSHYVDEQAAIVQTLIKNALTYAAQGSQDQIDQRESVDPGSFPQTQVETLENNSTSSWVPQSVRRALTAALNGFGSAPPSVISTNLRASFTQTEILALIQFLRQQLFQGGHTQSFRSVVSSDTEEDKVVSLDAAIRVLSCCVDSIGPLGLIGTMENEAFIDSIISDLVTEIAGTKQSLEDAIELQGILRETLRYNESLDKHHGTALRSQKTKGQGEEPRPGTIVTLYAEGSDGAEEQRTAVSLPLSLRADDLIYPVKTRKGGGQKKKRSTRQMVMLKQRQIGPYSLERLTL